MASRVDIQLAQVRWAQTRGLSPDPSGYVATYLDNLFQPLSETAESSFRRGSGNELADTPTRAAKMRALHSSSALAVNVFDYWSRAPDKVLQALELPTGGVDLRFEAQFETGLDGNPPNLDLSIQWADGTLLGVESKFTEWLTPKPAHKEHFKPKYFPSERALWGCHGLHSCQALALKLNRHELHFRYLDVAQLLKHALGLACSGKRFELLYIYYGARVPEGEVHRREVSEFSELVAADFPFHSRTYQDVFGRLKASAQPQDEAYISYLQGRYFS